MMLPSKGYAPGGEWQLMPGHELVTVVWGPQRAFRYEDPQNPVPAQVEQVPAWRGEPTDRQIRMATGTSAGFETEDRTFVVWWKTRLPEPLESADFIETFEDWGQGGCSPQPRGRKERWRVLWTRTTGFGQQQVCYCRKVLAYDP